MNLSPTPSTICGIVCAVYDVTPEQLRSRSRSHSLVQSRHVAAWFLREVAQMSLPEIGRELHRDHSTILVGLRKLAVERSRRPILAARMASVADVLLCEDDRKAATIPVIFAPGVRSSEEDDHTTALEYVSQGDR